MTPTPSEVTEEVTVWAVGGGIVTIALFPVALPVLLLTVAFVVPFLLAGAAIASVFALAASPIRLLRHLRSPKRRTRAQRAGAFALPTRHLRG